MYLPLTKHPLTGTELEERFWKVEREVWAWKMGMEDDKSVPLAEMIVTWIREKALQRTSVSTLLYSSDHHDNRPGLDAGKGAPAPYRNVLYIL